MEDFDENDKIPLAGYGDFHDEMQFLFFQNVFFGMWLSPASSAFIYLNTVFCERQRMLLTLSPLARQA